MFECAFICLLFFALSHVSVDSSFSSFWPIPNRPTKILSNLIHYVHRYSLRKMPWIEKSPAWRKFAQTGHLSMYIHDSSFSIYACSFIGSWSVGSCQTNLSATTTNVLKLIRGQFLQHVFIPGLKSGPQGWSLVPRSEHLSLHSPPRGELTLLFRI
jgi:hypothetical protein